MRQPDRVRSQLWRFAYLVARRVLSLVVLVLRSRGSKEIEILVLRHEPRSCAASGAGHASSRPIGRGSPL